MVDNRTYAVMLESAGRWRARRSSVPGWGTEYRRCSCSLLNTSQSTRSRTSGSRCRSSGRSSISSRHTHASSSHQPARMPPYFVGTSFEACKTVSPWVCLLGTHTHTQTPRDEIYWRGKKKKKITVWKNCTRFKSRIGIADVCTRWKPRRKRFW